jgi:putative N6-adenine-specific DNA methylase
MSDYQIVVSTYAGLEEVLAKELQVLGGRDIERHTRAVSCTGDKGFVYKANFSLRTALRVMVTLNNFKFRDDKGLYDGVKEVEWSSFINPDQTISVRCTLSSDAFTNNLYPALKAKDAIVDYFREKTGKRPDVDRQDADVQVSLFIQERTCTVQLNSSGASLHLRGYRQDVDKAPMSEVLAAGLILLTGWEGPRPLVDFMCGSGTIPIEAALIAARIPPGVFRDKYAFEKWPDFDEELFTTIRNKQVERIAETPVKIFGNELVRRIADKANENVEAAKVEDIVTITSMDYRDFEPPVNGGIVITNPPYGEKLEQEDLQEFYKEMGDTLKRRYSGYTAWIFTGTPEAHKWVGLRPSRKIPLFNGAIECRFMKYELFTGSKKDLYQTS